MKVASLEKKDLLGIKELSAEEITLILDTADAMKPLLTSPVKKTSHLQGKSVVMLFYESSTRTRLSFEMAAKFLGAASANVSSSGSSVSKGENLYDTAKTIEDMATDIIVMRHGQSGAPHFLSSRLECSIINGGDGMNEHPSQALLDMLTMRQHKGRLEGLKVAIIGDVEHSRVLRSNLWGLGKMGAELRVFAPPTMMPRELEASGAILCKDPREACEEADVVMGLRVQLERLDSALFPSIAEYAKFFSIDEAALNLAKEDAIIMHPGPCNRGIEMSSAIHDHERSVIGEQVTNGVAIRMAILSLLSANRTRRFQTQLA